MGLGRGVSVLVSVIVALVSIASGCSPAFAAFSGSNGVLVVQPRTGSGLLLVDDASGRAREVCTEALLCGRPTLPRWSPDGRSIVFVDRVSQRPVVLAEDGSCLWCLLGSPLTTLTGSGAGFGADGKAVILVRNGGLWQVPLDGSADSRVVPGPVDDAVSSSVGTVAVVRSGAVWVGRPGHRKLRRLGQGTAPSWSPDGTRIALVRSGWIWLVAVGSGHERRLIRGGAPAWSPDGRSLAFIAPAGSVEVVAMRGGRPHRVGSARGVAVDWQPLPAFRSHVCALPGGAMLMKSGSAAVVYSRPRINGFTVFGCLRAVGRPMELGAFGDFFAYWPEHIVTLGEVALAGRFVATSWLYYSAPGDACRNVLE